jgi:hypothetical protein
MALDSQTNNLFGSLARLFSRALIPVALLVFAAPFIELLFYSSLSADDFCYATLASCPGSGADGKCVTVSNVLTRAWIEPTEGSGRLLAPLLESLVMSKSNLSYSYGWLLLLVMLTNIAALWYFFITVLDVPRTRAWLAAGVFYAGWLACVTSPGENVFWLTGAMEYQLPISSMLVLAGLISKRKHSIFGYIALALLAIAIPSQHEIAGAFLLACLLAGVVAVRVLKLQADRWWWLCLGLVVLSCAATMLSPGMADKMTRGHSTGFVSNFLPHAKRVVNFGVAWTTNPVVLLCALCIPLLVRPDNDSSADGGAAYQPPPRWLALAALGAMCVLLVEFAGAETASSSIYGQLPARAVGWFQFIFWLLLICVVLIGVPELSKIRFSPSSRIGIFALLTVSLLASGNFLSAERDLRGPARDWWRGSVARLKQRGSMLQFEPLPKRPKLFRNTSLSMESHCWVNESMAFYVGATTVVTTDPGEEPDLAGCIQP